MTARSRLPRPIRSIERRLRALIELAAMRIGLIPAKSARERVFQDIYRRGKWGGADDGFFSGPGSRGHAAADYVDRMSALIAEHQRALGRPVRVVDIGCGDFRVGMELTRRLPDIEYVGCDIVQMLVDHHRQHHARERISFMQLDIVAQRQPRHPAGPLNPDKPTGQDVRFDWRTGAGRGVELSHPPFSVETEVVLRAPSPPNEILVTERVRLRPAAALAHAPA